MKNIWRSEKFLLILHVTKNRNSNDYLVRGKYQELILKNSVSLSIFCQVNDTPDPRDLLATYTFIS